MSSCWGDSLKFDLSSSPCYCLQPGMFPPSLRGYVERALARCRDEKQRAACQEIMKEVSHIVVNIAHEF